MDQQRLLVGLDADQREAVTTSAMPLAVIAAAGSGKTTVLTRRIAHRILAGTAEASHTLALTFTRDAAGELKRRLRRLELRDPIEAGTFHSVALRLLRDQALALYRTTPGIAIDRPRLVKECLTELRLDVPPQFAIADIDWARARMIRPDGYEAACRKERRRGAVPPARFAEVESAYRQLKRRRGVIDFDDLLERILVAMRDVPTFADAMRWRFRHIYVDEAQDLNPLQHAVVEAFRDGRPDICLVGDPRQAIFGWNGADSTTLANVEERYPGVTVLALTTNYRCTPQVVRAGAAALAAVGLVDDTRSDRPGGMGITVREYATDADEAVGVARQVRATLNHRAARDIAVLARTNEQVTGLQRALDAVGVPTERAVGRSPLEVALGEVYRVRGAEQLAAWAEAAFDDADPVRRRVAEAVDRYLLSGRPGGLRSWVEMNTPFDDLTSPVHDAVAVLSFHAAKGREWGTVVVTGVEEDLVPHRSATWAVPQAEEARLLYVALTRAEHDLTITYARQRKDRATQPSPWLTAVEASGASDVAVAPPSRTVAPASADPMSELRTWRAAVARVGDVPELSVCNDRVLRSLLADPPASAEALAARLGMSLNATRRLRPLPGGRPPVSPPARR